MRTTHLLPLGDSITDGGMKRRAYRYHLHQYLVRAGHGVTWHGSLQGVYDMSKAANATSGRLLIDEKDWPLKAQRHEGHWGWTSRQLLRGHEKQPQKMSFC